MVDAKTAQIFGSLFALQTCVRVLIAASPEQTAVKRLLPIVSEEIKTTLEELTYKGLDFVSLAELSIAMDEELYLLTSGLVGESPIP